MEKPTLIDGMNEKGLAVSVFYLPGYAHFQNYDPAHAQESIGPQDVTLWILTTPASVKDVREALPKVSVVPVKEERLGGIVPPIHFMVTDVSGESIVVECYSNINSQTASKAARK